MRTSDETAIRTWEASVQGVRTVVREAGPPDAEEAVVFLHGNPGSGADWTGLLTAFGEGVRAVAWDAPGFGRADKPAGFPHTPDAHAAHVDAMLTRLGVARAHMVAHDLGGPWALGAIALRPERLASLTLINTGVLLGYRWHVLARIWRTPLLGEAFMAVTSRPAFRALIERRGNPRGLPAAFTNRMYDDFDRATRRAVLRAYRSLDAAALSAEAAPLCTELDPPTLVIWGAHDPYISVAHAEGQRKVFPRAEVVVLRDSGHWPFVDDPDGVRTALTDFLRPRLDG